jgi:hypothetical protein
MNALQVECVKVALKQDATGYVLTLKIHPDEIPEELLRDFVGSRYVMALVRLNSDETPVNYVNRVKEAGMICRDFRFWKFLDVVKGIQDANEQIATEYLYESCGMKSRTELNGNSDAKIKFDDINKEFKEWRDDDEPF